MNKILSFALSLVFSSSILAAGNDILLTQRNSTDTGSITRVMPSPASGDVTVFAYNGTTVLPVYLTLNSQFTTTSGILGLAPISYTNLINQPTLGTVAALNVAVSGDAAVGEVVKGSDSRLTDSRNPLAHTQAFSTITATPTTLGGYGITDGVTNAGLTSALGSYVTTTSLSTTLGGYATTGALATGLSGKLNNPSGSGTQYLDGTGTPKNFPTTLSGYGITDAYPLTGNPSGFLTSITSTQISTALGYTPYNGTTNPNSYITSSVLSTTLGSYVTSSSLSTTLGNYVTSTSLTSTLSGYATTGSLTSGLAGKENTITAGTTSQYFRGDKTWQTLATVATSGSASDLSTGTLATARLPSLSISQTTGLQAALDAKLTIPSGTTSQVVLGNGSLGTLPVVPTVVSAFTNDSGYVNQSGARSAITLTTTGSGAASYNSTTGALNIPTPSASGTVTSVGITSTNLTVSNSPITTSGNISVSLPNTGTAGTYNGSVTTDALGRVTAGTTLSINDNPGRSLVTSTSATGYQISSTRVAFACYEGVFNTTSTIGGPASGTVVLETALTNSTTPSDWTVRARQTYSNNITLAVVLNQVQANNWTICREIRAGEYVRLRSSITGTASVAIDTQQETLR